MEAMPVGRTQVEPDQRQVIVLRYLADLSLQEIADRGHWERLSPGCTGPTWKNL